MSLPKLYIRDRIYIPTKSLSDVDDLKQKYIRHMFHDAGCVKCEYKHERPCAVCESCGNYQGVTKLWVSKYIGGRAYIGVPVGDKRNVEKKAGILFDEHCIVDLRHYAPFDYKIKFILELRPHQTKIAKDFLRSRYGMLEAPPRTGKTVLLLYIGLKLGQRMVLLANQHEYLQQFLWHIEGNEEEGIPKCTNLPEIAERVGKKLYGFPKTDVDFENMQFMVMTYQQFIDEKNGKNRFKKISRQVGTVAVDECFTGSHCLETDLGRVQISDIVRCVVRPSLVLSKNIVSGNDEYKPIISKTHKSVRQLCRVVIGNTSYVCTPSHLFWSKTRQSYVEAQHLKPSDEICFFKADSV